MTAAAATLPSQVAPSQGDQPGTPQAGNPQAGTPRPWWDPLGSVAWSLDAWKQAEKRLARYPMARVTTAVPRTARWALESIQERSEEPVPGLPRARMTASLISHVAMDESIMALAIGPNRFPGRSDYRRVGEELRTARAQFEAAGFLDDPVLFHPAPPTPHITRVRRGWALGRSYDRLDWVSGHTLPEGTPGLDRWAAFEANRTASAWVLRHDDRPRPWVVCVHGFGTGAPFMDLFGFRAGSLFDNLGVNVAAIVLPVHGSRRPNRISGDEFLSFDLMNSVHGLAQAVWDIRGLLRWVREQNPTSVGVFGVSLGGYLTAMIAGLEPELDMTLAGIPVVDFPELFRHHAPLHVQARAIEHNILDGTAAEVHRVVSALALPPVVAPEARAMFAGIGDRLAPPEQAHRLWTHWEEPETCWFPGNHVGYLWSGKVWGFVNSVLERRGLAA